MVDLDSELADIESLQDFTDDRKHLRVRDHEGIVPSNIEIALIELSESTFVHLRLITSVYFRHMEALNLLNTLSSDVTCERNSEIISQSK